jgi:cell division protein FtsL
MSYLTGGRISAQVIAERNAQLFADQQRLRRGPTLEFNFSKHIDNSRLVKAPDTVRNREMRVFSAVGVMVLTLLMAYGWQHFSAIEKGYSVEDKKHQVELLREENRQLRLSEAQLSQPTRIDEMAREMGMVERQPDQVVRAGDPSEPSTASTPTLAQVAPQAVASAVQ